MLQKIGERIQGWIAWVVVAIIAVAFVLFGLEYYLSRSGAQQTTVASVNGVNIDARQVENAYNALQRTYVRQGMALNEQQQKQLKNIALQQLILDQVLLQTADKMKLTVSPLAIQQELAQAPIFQEQGRFSSAKFQQLLRDNGVAPEAFIQKMQASLLVNQLSAGIRASSFVLPEEVAQAYGLRNQQRDFGYIILPSVGFNKAPPTDEQINAFYKQNSEQFRTPEQVKVAYLLSTPKTSSEQMGDLVYTNPDSLEPAAKALALPIKTTGWLSQQGIPNDPLFSNPQVLSAIFSDAVFKQNNNSQPIELKNGDWLVVRIAERQASQIQPLAMVREQIKQRLQKEQGEKQAGLQAYTLQHSLEVGENKQTLIEKKNITRDTAEKTIPKAVLAAAFNLIPSADPAKKAVTTVLLPDGNYAIIRLDSIRNAVIAQASITDQDQIRTQLANRWAELDFQLFAKSALEKAKIKGVGR